VLQVGNVRYAFDPTLPADDRLVAAEVVLSDGSTAPLDAYTDQSILLVTNNFVAGGSGAGVCGCYHSRRRATWLRSVRRPESVICLLTGSELEVSLPPSRCRWRR
jgi:hypothetical protein